MPRRGERPLAASSTTVSVAARKFATSLAMVSASSTPKAAPKPDIMADATL
jgi:hypothetical protein